MLICAKIAASAKLSGENKTFKITDKKEKVVLRVPPADMAIKFPHHLDYWEALTAHGEVSVWTHTLSNKTKTKHEFIGCKALSI